MGRNETLLIVSFGSASQEARTLDIGGVEEALRRRCPDLPAVRVYTSPTIRRILAGRGEQIPSLEEALEEQAAAGAEHLYLLPTHLLPGYEYDAIRETAERFRPNVPDLRLAPPLLGDTDTARALAKVLMDRWPRLLGQAVILVGHGTAHPGNLIYPALQGVFALHNRGDLLVGTVEGWPGLEDLLPVLKRQGAERAVLVPLLLTAGTHVGEDIAGSGPESWKSRLEEAGLVVYPVLEGLGRLPQVQALYVRRLEEML